MWHRDALGALPLHPRRARDVKSCCARPAVIDYVAAMVERRRDGQAFVVLVLDPRRSAPANLAGARVVLDGCSSPR